LFGKRMATRARPAICFPVRPATLWYSIGTRFNKAPMRWLIKVFVAPVSQTAETLMPRTCESTPSGGLSAGYSSMSVVRAGSFILVFALMGMVFFSTFY
jgi:hypothetical protein